MSILTFILKTEPKISKETPFSSMEFMSAFQKHLIILTAFLKKKIINFET